MTVTAVVINVHSHGATVRLADGGLAAVSSDEFAANRTAYMAAYQKRSSLELVLKRRGRHASAAFPSGNPQGAAEPAPQAPAPLALDPVFEDRIGAYLKATQEWAPPDRPDPAQRHFIRKKRRAAFFEARNTPT